MLPREKQRYSEDLTWLPMAPTVHSCRPAAEPPDHPSWFLLWWQLISTALLEGFPGRSSCPLLHDYLVLSNTPLLPTRTHPHIADLCPLKSAWNLSSQLTQHWKRVCQIQCVEFFSHCVKTWEPAICTCFEHLQATLWGNLLLSWQFLCDFWQLCYLCCKILFALVLSSLFCVSLSCWVFFQSIISLCIKELKPLLCVLASRKAHMSILHMLAFWMSLKYHSTTYDSKTHILN